MLTKFKILIMSFIDRPVFRLPCDKLNFYKSSHTWVTAAASPKTKAIIILGDPKRSVVVDGNARVFSRDESLTAWCSLPNVFNTICAKSRLLLYRMIPTELQLSECSQFKFSIFLATAFARNKGCPPLGIIPDINFLK